MPFKYYQKVAKKLTLILGKKTQFQIICLQLDLFSLLVNRGVPCQMEKSNTKILFCQTNRLKFTEDFINDL